MSDYQYIVRVNSVKDGVTRYYGPFQSEEQAMAYALKTFRDKFLTWQVCDLETA